MKQVLLSSFWGEEVALASLVEFTLVKLVVTLTTSEVVVAAVFFSGERRLSPVHF